ncbi:hypothetical protein BDV96DRAFT_561772 [Lophiotrema nucula]|uniref:Translation initiation factor 3 N-terminal domain-containing protein n=1 Tax=Lophiotrema nucula TaxID=690887 RepID=A0A6A5ZTD0_9PLEO|nr:hypothetical protein BDV96DRAFT_561772 [Lophiotrema nucula]
MSPLHPSSTSRALFRVFIAPALRATPVRPQHAPLPSSRAHPSLSSVRWKSFVRRDTQRHAITDHYTLDNAIQHPYVNFVDANGQFRNGWDIERISYNRATHHLLLLNSGKQDAAGNQDPDNLPMCKIISKIDLRAQHEKKLDLERKRAKGLTATGMAPKNMELNWAISGNDLSHRLTKLKQFLQEGRKVEVLFGPKRRGRKATAEECNKVLADVRAMVDNLKGAGEVKEPEGTLGGVMTLVFEGRKIEEPKTEPQRESERKLERESETIEVEQETRNAETKQQRMIAELKHQNGLAELEAAAAAASR